MDHRERFHAIDAKIGECLVALGERITEFKASGQVGVAKELENQCDQIRRKLNG